jgi:hypothetical protein
MYADDEDLKSRLDDVAQQLSNTVLEIVDWEPWSVYFLEDLEMLAASLDAQHPKAYRAMLERLRDDIGTKLRKGTWKNRIDSASRIVREDL